LGLGGGLRLGGLGSLFGQHLGDDLVGDRVANGDGLAFLVRGFLGGLASGLRGDHAQVVVSGGEQNGIHGKNLSVKTKSTTPSVGSSSTSTRRQDNDKKVQV